MGERRCIVFVGASACIACVSKPLFGSDKPICAPPALVLALTEGASFDGLAYACTRMPVPWSPAPGNSAGWACLSFASKARAFCVSPKPSYKAIKAFSQVDVSVFPSLSRSCTGRTGLVFAAESPDVLFPLLSGLLSCRALPMCAWCAMQL